MVSWAIFFFCRTFDKLLLPSSKLRVIQQIPIARIEPRNTDCVDHWTGVRVTVPVMVNFRLPGGGTVTDNVASFDGVLSLPVES